MAASSLPNTTTPPLKGATLNTVTAAAEACGGEVHVLVAGHNAASRCGRPRRRSPAWPRCCMPTRRSLAMAWPRTSPPRCSPWPAPTATSVPGHGPAARTCAARGRRSTWPRSATPPGRVARHLRAPDLRRQRHRHRAERRRVKVITVRTTGFDAAAATGGRRGGRVDRAVADSGKSQLRRREIAKSDRPELTAAKIIVSGGRGHGQRARSSRSADPAGRQARRRAGRQPRRGRRRLRPQRLAGRPDRQDRRAAAVRGLRHLGRHPAPGRHEGQQGDRRDQQGSPRRRSSAWPTTASRPTCSRPCRSW
jgi:hypothetical protein